MSEAKLWVRAVELVLALLLHIAAGLAAIVAYWNRTDSFWGDPEPHPLLNWGKPAVIAWVVIALVLVYMTRWSYPRRRFCTQLLLPPSALAIWLGIVVLIGPYDVTLQAELNDSTIALSTAQLDPGPQSLLISNTTASTQAMGILRRDRPLTEIELSDGFIPYVGNMDWVGSQNIGPNKKDRHSVELIPGFYALVCARSEGYWHVVDSRCTPALFRVGSP